MSSDQCIKWTEEIILKIMEFDENILNILQVEIIPDDNW